MKSTTNTFKEMEILKRKYNWHIFYTRVNQEKIIFKQLEKAHIECYLPLKKSLKQWSDRKIWIEEPWFRCYIFVYISVAELYNVLNVPGIVNYVGFEGKPYLISDRLMTDIKTMINQREREIVVSREHLKRGQHTRVLYGPFKGVEGEVIQICNNYRIIIRIGPIGCNLYANIAKDEIVVADELASAPD